FRPGNGGHPITVPNPDLSPADLVKRIDSTQKRGFPRSRQAHQHKDLALPDIDAAVMNPQHLPCLGLDLAAFLALIRQRQRRLRLIAEHDADPVEFHGIRSLLTHFRPSMRSIRSSMIATMTITKPDSKPSEVFTLFNARTTGTPNPAAPTSAAMTTMDRDSMIVWFNPAMICGNALGNSTFQSN